MLGKTLLRAALLLCSVHAYPGLALVPLGNPQSMRVPQADLDLTRPVGQALLRERTLAAVKRVCRPPVPGLFNEAACVEATWKQARSRIAKSIRSAQASGAIAGSRHVAR